jgi:hypothetical protein
MSLDETDFLAMPQPLNRVVPNGTISLTPDALADKPEMAIVVTRILATWVEIEQQLAVILYRIIGGDHAATTAIYGILETQTLRKVALEAVAKVKLPPDDYSVFAAMLAAAERVATPRNQLAHWPWGICPERPNDLLLLANPDFLEQREIRRAALWSAQNSDGEKPDLRDFIELQHIDPAHIQTYTLADLQRSLRDIQEAHEIIRLASYFVDSNSILQIERGSADAQKIRAELLQKLNSKRLFREAASRIDIGRSNTQPKTDG